MTEEDIDKGERKRALLKMNAEKEDGSRKEGRRKRETETERTKQNKREEQENREYLAGAKRILQRGAGRKTRARKLEKTLLGTTFGVRGVEERGVEEWRGEVKGYEHKLRNLEEHINQSKLKVCL